MPRMTLATKLVLRVLLDAAGELYGREISARAGIASGTVQPILGRLEDAGWVVSRQEQADAHSIGRPIRRYWRLTAKGVTIAGYVATVSNETERQLHGRIGLAGHRRGSPAGDRGGAVLADLRTAE